MPIIPYRRVILSVSLAMLAGVAVIATRQLPDATAHQQPEAARSRITGVSVNLTRFGFEPSEITIPVKYFISVRNLTEQQDVVLTLSRATRQKLIEEPFKSGSRGWDKLVNLPPGDYLLSEKSNPNRVLKIKVIAN
ncbi:MAG: hypothetical protein IPM66_22950 [Acidobacteriota bacterium]|nr:MAG: hypothetical protein IPM66_22950 [Acidobacteriota bacterium]